MQWITHLVDDNEKHLVVLRTRGAWLLEAQQLRDLNVAGICDGAHGRSASVRLGTAIVPMLRRCPHT